MFPAARVPVVNTLGVVVPEEHLWAMGDNAPILQTLAITWGSGRSPYVPVSSVVGTVRQVSDDTSRWTTDIAHHEIFAAVPCVMTTVP